MKFAKNLLRFLAVGLLAGSFPVQALAQSNSYPVGSRAIFLAGCLTDEPSLNLYDKDKVYSQMRICVCFLDKFQNAYTNTEFMTLFAEVEQNNSTSQQELSQFFAKHYSSCL